MLLHFTKMHGLGNDFVVIDLVTQHARIDEQVVRHLADRRFGIGCDQVLLVEPPDNPDMDFKYRVFNADGGEVEQCGNGARCFAIFVREQHLTGKQCILVETAAGPIQLTVNNNNSVTVNMGVPVLEPAAVPFDAPARALTYPLDVLQQSLEISAVSMGNPHAVVIVDDVDVAPVATLGPVIENHVRFPRRVNAGFLQILNRSAIKLRVYERGAGETLACGTGACAAVVAGNLRGLLDSRVTVHLPGGELLIEWQGEGQPVMMTGPAMSVFRGKIRL